MTGTNTDMKHPMCKAFLSAFVIFLIGILPILIASGGVYIWTGDYPAQTIVFIERIHRMLHSGQGLPAFDWGSMLGMDFLTSYHDHLFSPFEWFLYALPYAAVPYAHSLFMAGKIGLSAVTAYAYCRQYVKSNQTAYICGLLYAFSGFQIFNLVYQFSDRYLLFPLLLYCFDRLVIDKKPFCFAALLALNCLISPYFTWMICLFLLIYYVVRTATGSFPRLNLRLFLRLGLESVCGVFGGSIVLLPFYRVLSGNTRASDTIFGHSLLAFHEEGVVLRLFQSVFVFPEFCRSGWYFKSLQLSISPPVLYIPLFTVIGVILIWRRDRKSWYHYLISLCAVFACVPLFNSAFSAFNYNYYGRWLFMPLLIMVMMTGKYLDDFRSFAPRKLLLGYAAVLGFWILYGIYSVFFEENVAQDSTDLWPSAVAVAVMGVLILYLMHYPEQKIRFISFDRIRPIVCLCCFLPLLCSSAYLFRFSDNEFLQKQRAKIWNDFQPVHLEDDNEFFRTSCVLFPTLNASMMWDYPTINHFNSMITSDTCDFMNAADVICGQNPVLSEDDYALCSFLSVKYELFHNGLLTGGIHVEPEDINKEIEGFEQEPEQHRYIPFRNKAFIPMGYTFDYYLEEDFITEEDTDADEAADDEDHLFLEAEDEEEVFYTDHVDRQKLLLKAIWLTKSQVKKYGGFLKELPKELHDDVSVETYYKDCAARAASACYEFSPDGTGFTARINLPKENLVFFSVPYNKNFTAYVDGKETEIERVFNGLCAVYAPEGDHEIVFRYEIPWFKLGCLVSAGCAAVLLIYTAVDLLYKRREKKKAAAASA